MHKKMECPICKKKALFVGVHDWSGLSYALHHEGWGDCPLCTDGAYSTMGGMLFDTAKDAISALSPQNEPLTCAGCYHLDEQCAPCAYCIRSAGYADYYRCQPEGEEDT